MKRKIFALFLIFSFLATSGFGCKGGSTQAQAQMKNITLEYWGVWNDSDDIAPLIAAYQKIHPNISINYKKFTYDEYKEQLLNAWAEDRGPDLFSINASTVPEYLSKLEPMPAQITMAYPVEQGTIKKEIVPVLQTKRTLSLSGLKSSFLDTVYKDVALDYENPTTKQKETRIFGLPFSVDTMVMFYNKDLLNNANIGELSHYWNNQFQKDVKKLTKQNTQGEIIQSGVAMGGGNNIEKSSDIIAAIIMQVGGNIVSGQKTTMIEKAANKDYIPGIDAIRFYSDFSNPTKDVYSWNNKLDNSLKMFTEGRLAIMFGYNYHLPIIKSQAPKLNFGISPMPQVENSQAPKNVADYWVETVSKKSKYKNEAWDFINFAAVNKDAVKAHLAVSKKLAALRSLIEEQMNDNDLAPFAGQLLTAKTWYSGYNFKVADQALKDMMENIMNDPAQLEREVRLTDSKIKQTLYKPNN